MNEPGALAIERMQVDSVSRASINTMEGGAVTVSASNINGSVQWRCSFAKDAPLVGDPVVVVIRRDVESGAP